MLLIGDHDVDAMAATLEMRTWGAQGRAARCWRLSNLEQAEHVNQRVLDFRDEALRAPRG